MINDFINKYFLPNNEYNANLNNYVRENNIAYSEETGFDALSAFEFASNGNITKDFFDRDNGFEFDSNKDGMPDFKFEFTAPGNPTIEFSDIYVDTNFDGEYDFFQSQMSGNPTSIRKDTNYDNKIDIFNQYDTDKETGNTYLKQSSIDSNYDKNNDLKLVYNNNNQIEYINQDINHDNEDDYYHEIYSDRIKTKAESTTYTTILDDKGNILYTESYDFKKDENKIYQYNKNNEIIGVGTDTNNDGMADEYELNNATIDNINNINVDGIIGYSEQGATGDCWLLSGINALTHSEKGQEIIKNALEYNENGAVVHTKFGDYNVSIEEILIAKQKAQNEIEYSTGDDDMLVFELAIEKVRKDIKNKNLVEMINFKNFYTIATAESIEEEHLLDGGWGGEVLNYLTGEIPYSTHLPSEINNILDKFTQNPNSSYMGTNFIETKEVEDIYGNNIELIDKHTYSIKEVTSDSVTIVNPHDSSIDITLSRETFLKNSLRINYIDFNKTNKNNQSKIITFAEMQDDKYTEDMIKASNFLFEEITKFLKLCIN